MPMFEKLKRNPEKQKSKEAGPEVLFAQAEKYADLLLDRLNRKEAVCTEIDTSKNGERVGARISIFTRVEGGFKIDYYLHSLEPIETATFQKTSEDQDFGPQSYRATFTNTRLPYDQTSYTDPRYFVESLEMMFGPIPEGLEIDQAFSRRH